MENKKSNWENVNKLTHLAYKSSKKAALKIFLIITIITSFIILFVGVVIYSYEKMFDYNSYRPITSKLKFPDLTPSDFQNMKIYDSDTSVFVNEFEELMNKKINPFFQMNPSLAIYLKLLGYDYHDFTLKLYRDKFCIIPIRASDIIYIGKKQLYLKFFFNNKSVPILGQKISVLVQYQNFYFQSFYNFKLMETSNDIINLDSNYLSAYMPTAIYKSNIIELNANDNLNLITYINDNLSNLLENEKRETFPHSLDITPYISTNELPPITKISDLEKLKRWFLNPDNKYLYMGNASNEPLDLNNDSTFYITYFPKTFNVSQFIISDAQNYFNTLNNSLLPIQEYQDQQLIKHYYFINNNDGDVFYKYSLCNFYQKQILNLIGDNIENDKTKLLNYLYKVLCSSIQRSYLSNLEPNILLEQMFNISQPTDLIPYVGCLTSDRLNIDKPITFSNITIEDIKIIHSMIFSLPFVNSNWSWESIINFYKLL